MTPAALYHFTCHHAYLAIGAAGALLPPRWHMRGRIPADLPNWQRRAFDYVWTTDLPVADAAALGLTSHATTCDRTAYRYRITDRRFCEWWPEVTGLPRRYRADLELTPGVRPDHWWIASVPVAAVLDM